MVGVSESFTFEVFFYLREEKATTQANMIEPNTFDAIVVGTGLPESILAASIAAAGKTVLHLDAYEGYLSPWASPSFSTLSSFASLGGCLPKASFSAEEELTFSPEEIEYKILEVKDAPALYSHVKVSPAHDESSLGRLNRYSLDLAGKDFASALNLKLDRNSASNLENPYAVACLRALI